MQNRSDRGRTGFGFELLGGCGLSFLLLRSLLFRHFLSLAGLGLALQANDGFTHGMCVLTGYSFGTHDERSMNRNAS
mgnify:FL=1